MDALLLAAGLLVEHTAARRGGSFDAQQQSYFLSAIRLMLALGNEQQAEALLEKRSSLEAHRQEVAVMRRLARGERSTDVSGILDDVFDEMRDPLHPPQRFTETPLGILEIALLRDRLLVAPAEPYSASRLIVAIAT